MIENPPLDEVDAEYSAMIPGSTEAYPFSDWTNDAYDHGKYPTVIYNFQGRPVVKSCTTFAIAMLYASQVRPLAERNDVSLIWTDRYWNV